MCLAIKLRIVKNCIPTNLLKIPNLYFKCQRDTRHHQWWLLLVKKWHVMSTLKQLLKFWDLSFPLLQSSEETTTLFPMKYQLQVDVNYLRNKDDAITFQHCIDFLQGRRKDVLKHYIKTQLRYLRCKAIYRRGTVFWDDHSICLWLLTLTMPVIWFHWCPKQVLMMHLLIKIWLS